jgi:8-oxo-dGTP pyrophosphatase MutT (NUDIX family)
MKRISPIHLSLTDTEWSFTHTSHDRTIVRAIVVDGAENFYFVRAERDDDFGRATIIETSGGGVEADEDLDSAIKRELSEELGAEVDILCKLGVVSDYYNLIHRHNINHYYLCRIRSFGERHLTKEEAAQFHLSTLRLSYREAVEEYRRCACTPLGRLIAARELPILAHAGKIMKEIGG